MLNKKYGKFYIVKAVIPSKLWELIKESGDVDEIDRIVAEAFCVRYDIEPMVVEVN